jgi:hypothetical protein
VLRAKAVNTLCEPMDGAWYTHRHYWHPLSLEELARGAGGTTPPSTEGPWTVVSAKTQGVGRAGLRHGRCEEAAVFREV